MNKAHQDQLHFEYQSAKSLHERCSEILSDKKSLLGEKQLSAFLIKHIKDYAKLLKEFSIPSAGGDKHFHFLKKTLRSVDLLEASSRIIAFTTHYMCSNESVYPQGLAIAIAKDFFARLAPKEKISDDKQLLKHGAHFFFILRKKLHILSLEHIKGTISENHVVLSDEFCKQYYRFYSSIHLSPYLVPMLCIPNKWTANIVGGYLTSEFKRHTHLVRHNNRIISKKCTPEEFLPEVYDSLKAIQGTRWALNKRMLFFLQDAFNLGVNLPDVYNSITNRTEALSIIGPIKKELRKEYKKEERDSDKIHRLIREINFEKKKLSRLSEYTFLLSACKHLGSRDFYFPWTFDFRGRIYPCAVMLEPQGSDIAKSLLMFADKIFLSDDSIDWVAVHGANCFGLDKVSFADRIAWVSDHERIIFKSATNPSKDEFWRTASKPFSFLAFCFEWHDIKKYGSQHRSGLPIFQDGTCNAFQHYAALLLDPTIGKHVNIIPNDKPYDIYSLMLNTLYELIDRADKEAFKDICHCIDRTLIKKCVMPFSYGMKFLSMKDVIADHLAEKRLSSDDYKEQIKTLYYFIKEIVRRHAPSFEKVKQWLANVANETSKHNIPIKWTTPLGFVVYHHYANISSTKQISTAIGSLQLKQIVDDGVNRYTQRDALPPNFIHSLDASHCLKTILELKKKGIHDFAPVYDCIAVHANNVSQLKSTLAETFIEIYTRNVLKDFKDEFESQHPDFKLPDPPERGDLDINLVRNSDYFYN